jgi:hypothetical protein
VYTQIKDLAKLLGLTPAESAPALVTTGNCVADTAACSTEIATWTTALQGIRTSLTP